MTTPPPGQALTAETVKLLVKGDLLNRFGAVCTYAGEMARHEGCMLATDDAGLDFSARIASFTFIGRPDASGWIAWSGGDNPVTGQWVQVRQRGYQLDDESCWFADQQRWTDTGHAGDIIAFRLASQSTAPTRGEGEPVAVTIFCPQCATPHVDEDEWATTRHHKTHQCQSCGQEWRPFPFATVGVAHPAPVFTLQPLVTDEAAAARIALLTAQDAMLRAELVMLRHDRQQAEARADRLAKALGEIDAAAREAASMWEADYKVKLVPLCERIYGLAAEALREPKSGGGE